jgi:hypothetical protein
MLYNVGGHDGLDMLIGYDEYTQSFGRDITWKTALVIPRRRWKKANVGGVGCDGAMWMELTQYC